MLPRFTIGQILIATVAIGCGLAVARLPHGSWYDFFPVTVGLFLASGLVQRLASLAKARRELAPEVRSSAVILAWLLAVTTGAIGLGLFVRYYSATGWAASADKSFYLNYLTELPMLSLMLILVGSSVAVSLGQPEWPDGQPQSARVRLLNVIGIVCLLVALVAFWCNNLYVWFLIYIALRGIDVSYPYGLLPPEPMNFARDARYFALGAILGLPLCLVHLSLIAGCVSMWRKPRWRSVLIVALVALVMLECALMVWLAGPGLHAISPHYVEVMSLPAWQPSLMVVAMVVLVSAWLAFRLTAHGPETPTHNLDEPLASLLKRRFVHERLIGALAVSAVGIVAVSHKVLSHREIPFVPWLEGLGYEMTLPESLLMIATALTGLALVWRHWRSRASKRVWPRLNVSQFATVQFAIATAIALGGPLIAAFTFALMLFGFGMTH